VTRYAAMFDRLASRREIALGSFVMLGDPTPSACAAYLDALVAGGADMVELGIPFSDPVADGPVIQAAAKRALDAKVSTADAIRLVADFRQRHPDVPVGILTYANIVASRGIAQFCSDLADAGVDSLLVADVPSLEAEPYAQAASDAFIDYVMIAAPNTGDEALARIASLSSGYTYCVARAGVTGHAQGPRLAHRPLFDRLRKAGAPPPVLGFGIGSPAQVGDAASEGAAGVISGSAIVDRIGRGLPPQAIADLVWSLKAATFEATNEGLELAH
jgi:tryptophan synthase alpha chain